MSGTKRWLDPGSGASASMRAMLSAARSDLPGKRRIDEMEARLIFRQAGPPRAASGGGALRAAGVFGAKGAVGGSGAIAGVSAVTGAKLAAASIVAISLAGGGYMAFIASPETEFAAQKGSNGVEIARRAPAPMRPTSPPSAVIAPLPVPSFTSKLAVSAEASPRVFGRDGPPFAAASKPARVEETEISILEAAQDDLASNPISALARANHHANRFPAGALAQEREVIAIDALMRMNRTDEARFRASRFFEDYPNSAHRKRIEDILNAEPLPHNL